MGRRISTNHLLVLISLSCFAALGAILLVVSRAATSSRSLEPESGMAVGVQSYADGAASGGSSIRFAATPSDRDANIWRPALNSPWMWYLNGSLNTANANHMGTGVKDYLGNDAPDPIVYNIDGFDNTASTVSTLKAQGKRVICYISAGTSEDWRPDYGSFTTAVKGSNVDGWAGEKWLDVRNLSVLGPIMTARLDMCKSKGFDAVEFDNVDGYTNNSGLPLTTNHQLAYNKQLAQWAHERGLSAALKNDIDQIPQLWQDF